MRRIFVLYSVCGKLLRDLPQRLCGCGGVAVGFRGFGKFLIEDGVIDHRRLQVAEADLFGVRVIVVSLAVVDDADSEFSRPFVGKCLEICAALGGGVGLLLARIGISGVAAGCSEDAGLRFAVEREEEDLIGFRLEEGHHGAECGKFACLNISRRLRAAAGDLDHDSVPIVLGKCGAQAEVALFICDIVNNERRAANVLRNNGSALDFLDELAENARAGVVIHQIRADDQEIEGLVGGVLGEIRHKSAKDCVVCDTFKNAICRRSGDLIGNKIRFLAENGRIDNGSGEIGADQRGVTLVGMIKIEIIFRNAVFKSIARGRDFDATESRRELKVDLVHKLGVRLSLHMVGRNLGDRGRIERVVFNDGAVVVAPNRVEQHVAARSLRELPDLLRGSELDLFYRIFIGRNAARGLDDDVVPAIIFEQRYRLLADLGALVGEIRDGRASLGHGSDADLFAVRGRDLREKVGHIVVVHQAVAEEKNIEHFVLLDLFGSFGHGIGRGFGLGFWSLGGVISDRRDIPRTASRASNRRKSEQYCKN